MTSIKRAATTTVDENGFCSKKNTFFPSGITGSYDECRMGRFHEIMMMTLFPNLLDRLVNHSINGRRS